jgi:hypothetical protein
MTNPFGPFGTAVERLGDMLINKISDEIFGEGDAARLTRVVIYNHTDQALFFLDSSFESGGFSAGMQPSTIESTAIGGYRVESHGAATGVTGATVHFGLSPTDDTVALEVVTSNPFIGDNTGEANGAEGLTARSSVSVGNANQFDVDVFAA